VNGDAGCAAPAATSWRSTASTRGRCRPTWATAISRTRRGTQRWRRIGSRAFDAIDATRQHAPACAVRRGCPGLQADNGVKRRWIGTPYRHPKGALTHFWCSLGFVWRSRRGRISAMQQALRRASLVPAGFVVESAFCQVDRTVITVRPSRSFGPCPSCGTISRRVHSYYRRCVTDLPLSGHIVQLVVIARRFRCDAVLCGRQIFTERFADSVLAPSARRTTRLDCIVHHLGLALGGRPAAGFAKRLMLPVSNDTTTRCCGS
jgi:transposase IS204/IS1001/IS1096/IS1165 family protein